eukprot:2975077-Rhodomonas_salina.3
MSEPRISQRCRPQRLTSRLDCTMPGSAPALVSPGHRLKRKKRKKRNRSRNEEEKKKRKEKKKKPYPIARSR